MSPFGCKWTSSTQLLWSVASKAVPLFHIRIYNTCKYQRSWGDGIITPIFKKGDANDAQNYRDLTLINVIVCSIWENFREPVRLSKRQICYRLCIYSSCNNFKNSEFRRKAVLCIRRLWKMLWLHTKVRLPVLLCAIKTVEGDFRLCWMISPNVGQTHKENPNLVRIFYIEWYIQTVQQIIRTLIHKSQFTSLCRGQKPASKMHQTCIWNTGHMQSIAGPVLASAVWTDEKKKKKKTLKCSYRIFIVCRSPVSPVFWARILLS